MLWEKIKKLLVYGSYARGDYNENSDVDIMILTSIAEDKIEQMEDVLYDKAFDFWIKAAINRSYYAAFYALKAVLAIEGKE